MLKEWNRTFLVLLPKVSQPELVSQFRPIGLCNVLYKCIAKCITNRLRGVLPTLISGFQNEFVPGRLISDNALTAHELLSFMNASKACKRFYAALKLDMNKAYDRVRLVEEHALFSGIHISRGGPSVSHLFFANDSLLFFQVSPQACENIMNLLSQFCSSFGQMINLQKSYVKFSPNTPPDYRDYLARSLRVQSKPSFGTYLGLPIDLGWSKVSDFKFLIDRVASRLSAFASLRLSVVAKLVIINSVLVASFNHILSVFKIPSSIASHLDSMLASFWWRSSGSRKGIALRSASLLHLPKGLGGLGLHSIGCFNLDLVASTGWRMMNNPQLLVSRLMVSKYPTLFALSANRITQTSWGCRGLQSAMSVVAKGVRWKVGCGSSVRIKVDEWAPGGLVSFKDGLSESELPTHVSSIIDPRFNAWDSLRVHRLFDGPTASRILSLDRPQNLMDDFVYWKFTRYGSFSTKSAYFLFLQQDSLTTPVGPTSPSWWRKLWGLPILPKWKSFAWKVVHSTLPVASTLFVRGISVDPICCFCHREPETVAHLFRGCDFISLLWGRSSLGFHSPGLHRLPFLNWFSTMVSLFGATKDWVGLINFFSILWAICLSRNNVRFRQLDVSPTKVLSLASQWCARGHQAQDFRLKSSSLPLRPRLSVTTFSACYGGDPLSGLDICLLCDGSWSSDNSRWWLDFFRIIFPLWCLVGVLALLSRHLLYIQNFRPAFGVYVVPTAGVIVGSLFTRNVKLCA
ncbi:uncharacterized protein LOC110732135 [Chenopodium quinoa]|uniref:uncharacterized protein LOC110732135 n=1 Tax=Chenopodium quinoa TaxID=63459 RepID=UPI000B78CCAB|nr:uncharacterized protein LOC110732135 [Chenopodium quinoa]